MEIGEKIDGVKENLIIEKGNLYVHKIERLASHMVKIYAHVEIEFEGDKYRMLVDQILRKVEIEKDEKN